MGAYIPARAFGSPMIHRVSDNSFARQVLASAEPVLVAFVADDCGPCRTIVSILEQLAPELEGSVQVATIDIGQNPENRARYNIHGLPALTIFIGGELAARRVGAAIDKDGLKAWLEAAIGSRER